jgi:hypothetical protein
MRGLQGRRKVAVPDHGRPGTSRLGGSGLCGRERDGFERGWAIGRIGQRCDWLGCAFGRGRDSRRDWFSGGRYRFWLCGRDWFSGGRYRFWLCGFRAAQGR